MIDLHSHILPAVDDGAESPRVSVEMLDAARAIGIRTIAATPHLTERLTSEYDATVQAAYHQIEADARERGITLIRGFEIRLDPALPAWLREGDPITLDGSRVVLVDLPFIDWPHYVDETLFNVQTSGYQVILAHPERYPKIQDDPALGLELARRGIALQVNISSVTGIFGRRAKRAAEELLRLGAVHLVATDAHSAGHRMAAVPDGLKRLGDLAGEESLRQLTTTTPASLLNGDQLPAPIAPKPRVTGLRRVFSAVGR